MSQLPAGRDRRDSDPGFRTERLVRALLTSDTRSAEVWVGGWLVAMRGIMLASMGFAYNEVAYLLETSVGATHDRVGFLLLASGIAQIAATGWSNIILRAGIAFSGSIINLGVWLAYLGLDLEHTALAWTWFALLVSETTLCWRILLSRHGDNGA